ncbi:hypothetical protein J6525_19660 [Bradyrhizobium sp. WSM 4400]|nr:hypothetical protein [Bradyrhizobium australafricanum]
MDGEPPLFRRIFFKFPAHSERFASDAARQGRQVADVAVDHAGQVDDRVLVGPDRVEIMGLASWNGQCSIPLHRLMLKGGLHMLKIGLVLAAAAAALTTTSLAIPAKAEGIRMAQGVDVQIGRDREDRYYRDRDYRDRDRYDRDTTVGVGPGGITVGPRQRCRTETVTVDRDDGRRVTRRERRCD